MLLEGKILAEKIQEGIKSQIKSFSDKNYSVPRLVSIQVSEESDHAWYVSSQRKLAEKLGIEFVRIPPADVKTEEALLRQIKQASQDPSLHGLFVTMPLPANYKADLILSEIPPQKDVEGIHPFNLGLMVLRKARLIPSTAFAALKLIESTKIELRGKRATIIGQSAIVGRPLQLLLGEQRVTTMVCNTGTSESEIRDFVSSSDIVVACAGSPGLIKGSWIKPGSIVIDIGTTERNGKLVGDVEFEEAKKHAGFITPVPGGVGPLTVTMLMQNLMAAYQWQNLCE